MTNEIYLSVKEIAFLLKISESTVYRLIESTNLPASKIGPGTWRVKKSELDKFIEKNKKINGKTS
jgi:excisionase family DNA binding protein